MTSGRRWAAVGLLALLCLGAGPAPAAQAHASLQESTPRDGQVVAEPPSQLLLGFDEPVEDGLSAVRVFAADRSRMDRGQARSPLQDARQLSIALNAGLPQGSYLVDWRVVSRDSHLITGTFTFSVGRRGEVAAGVTEQSGAVDAWVLGILRLALFTSMAITAGGSLFLLVCWPAAVRQRRVRSTMTAAAALGAFFALATIPLQAAHDSTGRLFPLPAPATVQSFLFSTLGIATTVKLACFVLTGLLLPRAVSSAPQGRTLGDGRLWLMAGLAFAQIAAIAASGHAAGSARWVLVDATHLLAVAVWLGGLILLTVAFRGQPPPGDLERAAQRFSPVAALCVTVLVLTGLLQGARQVLGLRALAETDYGALLTAKVALLGVMLVGAFAARRAVRRGAARETTTAERSTTSVRRTPGRGTDTLQARAAGEPALGRSLRTEAIFGTVILAVTAALVATPPARVAYRPSLRRDLVTGPVTVGLSVNPLSTGKLSIHAYTTKADGTLDTSSTVELRATQPERNINDLEIPLESTEPGHFGSDTVDLPAAGAWTLDVVVTTAPAKSYTASTSLEVR